MITSQAIQLALYRAVKACDSWSQVKDSGKRESGRYSVIVFFGSEEEALRFEGAVRDVTMD